MSYGSNINLITKEGIFEHISEIDIFEYYLGVRVDLNVNIISPTVLRSDDESPGCIFYYNGEKIKFLDRSKGINEDCFGIVKRIHGGNYNDVLYRIASDFSLFNKKPITQQRKIDNSPLLGKVKKEGSTFRFQIQKWTEFDKKYWLAKDIHSPTLDKFKVNSVSVVFLYNKIIYEYSYGDPCYVYQFHDGTVQFYRPFAPDKKDKFRTNSQIVLGWDYLPQNGNNVIITKSYKDIILLTDLYDYPSVAPIGEGKFLPERYIKSLERRFDNIFILYDNDDAGIRNSERNVQMYDCLIPIFFDKDIGKDVDEVTLNIGVLETKEILDDLILC